MCETERVHGECVHGVSLKFECLHCGDKPKIHKCICHTITKEAIDAILDEVRSAIMTENVNLKAKVAELEKRLEQRWAEGLARSHGV